MDLKQELIKFCEFLGVDNGIVIPAFMQKIDKFILLKKEKKPHEITQVCPDCKSTSILYDDYHNKYICRDCNYFWTRGIE